MGLVLIVRGIVTKTYGVWIVGLVTEIGAILTYAKGHSMKTRVKRKRTQFLWVGAAMLALCTCPGVVESAESALAIQLTNEYGRNYYVYYALSEIEGVSFGGDMIHVTTIDQIDSYTAESIVRIEFLIDYPTGIENPEDVPGLVRAVHLLQNVPNPFNPDTRISFELPREGRAELRIYAVNGMLIRTLVDARLPAGRHSVRWDGCDEAGRRMASGVYFYSLAAPGVDESRKMILVK